MIFKCLELYNGEFLFRFPNFKLDCNLSNQEKLYKLVTFNSVFDPYHYSIFT